ncbi:MAG TPA: porin [Thermoanaerobaculia bacterium]
MRNRYPAACFIGAMMIASGAFAQAAPAAGAARPDDTPKINVGALIFADYTYVESPKSKDADGNSINNSSFNVTRAYINITGSLNHLIAFRITPDIVRETNATPSVSGSQIFRLKYAYAQLNLDDWATKGSWARVGIQQTPYSDYTETIYRYRFQGSIFAERTTGLFASDAGVSAHYNFNGNYGDVHAGFYNGEGYPKAEVNNEKAFMVRGTVRPFPLGGAMLKGLRLTAFIDEDHYVAGAKRERDIGQITYEHPLVNAGFDVLRAKDRTSAIKPQISAKGWSVWVTPKLGTTGWEALIRHDDFLPNDAIHSQKQKRDIDGIGYWVPNLGSKSAAILFDRDSLKRTGLTPAAPNTTNYEVKMLLSF